MNASQNAIYLKAAIAALEKSAKDIEAIEPGRYPINARIVADIRGSVLQSSDEKYIPTQEVVLNCGFLLLLLQYAGVTREAAIAAIPKALARQTELGGKVKDSYAEQVESDLKAGIKALTAIKEALPEKTRKGKFTPKVEAIDIQILPAAPGEENVAAS